MDVKQDMDIDVGVGPTDVPVAEGSPARYVTTAAEGPTCSPGMHHLTLPDTSKHVLLAKGLHAFMQMGPWIVQPLWRTTFEVSFPHSVIIL